MKFSLTHIYLHSLPIEEGRKLHPDVGEPKQRLALYVLQQIDTVPEHIETRTIYNTIHPNISQVCNFNVSLKRVLTSDCRPACMCTHRLYINLSEALGFNIVRSTIRDYSKT